MLSFNSYKRIKFEPCFNKRNSGLRSFTNNFNYGLSQTTFSSSAIKKESFNIGNIFEKTLYKASLELLCTKQDRKEDVQLYSTFNGYIEEQSEQERCLEIKIYLFYFEAQSNILLLVRDVSHRDLIKMFYNQCKAKQNSLNYVSHEYRTPLNCIITLLENCEEELQMDKDIHLSTIKNIRITLQNCYYLLNLSNDLLYLAQMKVGKFQLIRKKFNLYNLVEQTIEIFKINAMKKQITLKFEYNNEIDRIIVNDENRIKQVITNLIGNAFKFTLQGQIVVSVVQNKDLVQIRIQDTGIGIREEDKENLMKAFGKSESDESKALNRQGVGLGLLISNIIAQSLNTNGVGIRLESNYGQGSTFYFDISVDGNEESSLKRCNSINLNSIIDEEKSESKRSVNMNSWIVPQADQIQSIPVVKKSKFKNKRCNCIKILIIDDIYFNVLALQLIIKKYGIESTDYVISGEMGLEMINKRKQEKCCQEYKIVFLDLEMPGLNGYQTFQEIMKISENAIVVACSGHCSEKEKEKAFNMGFEDYLEKPLKKEEVQSILEKYVK